MAEQPRGDAARTRPVAFAAETTERGGVVVVSLTGELAALTAPRAAQVATSAIALGRPVVIDMTGLTFFSSAGLTLLIELDGQRRNPPVDVRLVADQRVVILPLRITGLQDLFPVHTSLDDALAIAI